MQYFMFNKPQGCVTARSDSLHRTVMDYFPHDTAASLHPVGRLDMDTCGLLLITDDGTLDHALMQPGHHIAKTYFFYAIGTMTADRAERLENGIAMADFTTMPARFRLIREYRIAELDEYFPAEKREKYLKNPDGTAFAAELTVCEGKKHQVKRMLEAVGCRIFYLRRVSVGGVRLDESLAEGEYRPLTGAELDMLRNIHAD